MLYEKISPVSFYESRIQENTKANDDAPYAAITI